MEELLKQCSNIHCNIKPISEFYINKSKNNGKGVYFSICKECTKNKSKNYSKNNPEVIKSIRNKYNISHKDQILEYAKKYDSKNSQKIFYDNNKEKFFNYKKERRKNDPIFKLTENIRRRIYSYVKNKSTKYVEYLGCDVNFYLNYLESQFTHEMNWGNYGSYWEIDHIQPLFSFDFTDKNIIKKAFSYKNTRPLTITENRTRSKKAKQ